MAKRYKKRQEATTLARPTTNIPINRPVAVYYRQSTDAQVGNVSTTIQTVDMVDYLKRLGWAEDDIIMIDMDEGVSGTTKIDERPGMQMLFDLITQGKIGAVACQDEDRLFRDVTQIQVNIFIEACRASSVMVLTPSMIYDFANEQTRMFHIRQFRFKSEMAAEYINAVIKGRLHTAKRRLLYEGRWAGAGIPPGYMVDMRRTLPDGSKNENWRHFVPFQPYAEVVNEYFRLFLENGGNLNATIRLIHKHGQFYPDPTSCRPPEGFKVVYRMRRYDKGYCPGMTGLAKLLTNAAYLGHWTVKRTVVKWDHHEPIVSRDMFYRAFNYLSDVNLDGSPNPDYRPIQENARPSREEDRPVERPLCTGMIVSEHKGEWRNVGTNWVSPLQHYTYTLWIPRYGTGKYEWSKAASFVDDAVVKLLHQKLRATFDSNVWDETLTSLTDDFAKEKRRITSQLQSLEKVMENQIASLDNLTNQDMIAAVQKRYEDARTEHARLALELSTTHINTQQLEAAYALKDTCEPALENWSNLNRSEKRVILHAFIQKIEAIPVEQHGLKLEIVWRDNQRSSVVLPRQATTGNQWLPSQVKQLLNMLDGEATQVEIAAAFPDRRWEHIRYKIVMERGKGSGSIHPKPIYDVETYQDFLERTNGNTQHFKASSGCRWQPNEIQELLELLDKETSKLELMERFSHRTWGRIRAKVTELKGKDFKIPGKKPMKRDETIIMYRQRIGEGNNRCEDRLSHINSETCPEKVPLYGINSPHRDVDSSHRQLALLH